MAVARYASVNYDLLYSFDDYTDGMTFTTASKDEFIRIVRKNGHDMGSRYDKWCGSIILQILNNDMEPADLLQEGKEGKDYLVAAGGGEYGFFSFEHGMFKGIFPSKNSISFGKIYYSHEVNFTEVIEENAKTTKSNLCKKIATLLNVKLFPMPLLEFLSDEENLYDDLPDEIYNCQLESKIQIPEEEKVPLTRDFARERFHCNPFVEIDGTEYAYNSTDEIYGDCFFSDSDTGSPLYGDIDYTAMTPVYTCSAYIIGKRYENESSAETEGRVVYDVQPSYAELCRNFLLLEKKEQADGSGDTRAHDEPWYEEAGRVQREWKAWETLGKDSIKSMIESFGFEDKFDTEHPRFAPYTWI